MLYYVKGVENMSEKQLLFSVTKKDLRIDYFKGSGKGGQKRNKTENCCRITHLESGAVGKSEEGRSKEHNKKLAFQRMAESEEFQKWHRIKSAEYLGLITKVEQELTPDKLKIEIKNEEGRWIIDEK